MPPLARVVQDDGKLLVQAVLEVKKHNYSTLKHHTINIFDTSVIIISTVFKCIELKFKRKVGHIFKNYFYEFDSIKTTVFIHSLWAG